MSPRFAPGSSTSKIHASSVSSRSTEGRQSRDQSQEMGGAKNRLTMRFHSSSNSANGEYTWRLGCGEYTSRLGCSSGRGSSLRAGALEPRLTGTRSATAFTSVASYAHPVRCCQLPEGTGHKQTPFPYLPGTCDLTACPPTARPPPHGPP